jgi:hypothetical protein
VVAGNTAGESGNNSASCGGALLLRPIISCRAPRSLLPLQHALCHELCGPGGLGVVCRLFPMSGIVVLGGLPLVTRGMLKMF